MHKYESVQQQSESSTFNSHTNRQGDNTNSSLPKRQRDKGKGRFEETRDSASKSKLTRKDVVRRKFEDTRPQEEPPSKSIDTYKDHITLLARYDTMVAPWPLAEETLNDLSSSDKQLLAPSPGTERTPGKDLLQAMQKERAAGSFAPTQKTDYTKTSQQIHMQDVRSKRNSRIAKELGIVEPSKVEGPMISSPQKVWQSRPDRPSAQRVRELNYPQGRQVLETTKDSFVSSIVRRAQKVTFGISSRDQAMYTRVSSHERDIPLGNLPRRQNPYESVGSRAEEKPITYPTPALTRVSRQPYTLEQPSSSNLADATGGTGQDKWWEIPI